MIKSLFFVVEHTVAKTFVFGIGNLLFEFGTHTLSVVGLLAAAGTVTARLFKSFFYNPYYLFIGV